MTFKVLTQLVSDEFNRAVKEGGFDNFKEMKRCYDWEASDIRGEVDYIVTDLLNKEYDTYVEKNGSNAGYISIVQYDDGTLYDMVNNEEMTYGQFKKAVFANVR